MDVAAWLRELGLERYEQAFRDNAIDAGVLPKLTAEDLRDLGVSAVGHRRKLLEAIAALTEQTQAAPTAADAGVPRAGKPPEAERRQLTVLFCDLVGSTALSARLDPEDMGTVMRAYHRCCAEGVKRWDGHVAKYLGDGVLAYFGWPQAHEDDAERAVRAGLELSISVGRLPAGDGTPLAARVGIATGPVVVGELIGAGASQEQTVVGETPNLAARLQALAEPGAVVISQATRRLVGRLFELTDLGPLRLKGFAERVQTWRVLDEGRAESRFEAMHGQQLTTLVGREHEIGLLTDRWERAKEGEGQVVLLSGEPGIGKSRIVRALRARLANEPHTPLSHYCSPHHTNSALYPVIRLLERAAGFTRDDRPEARLDKLVALLSQATEALGEVVPLVAALLGIETGQRYPALALTPQHQKQRTLKVLIEQVEGLAAQKQVLAVYEDVHWVDASTLEVLDQLIERAQRLHALVLITFRPEFNPPWTGHAHVMQLSLSRLTRRHGQALIDEVTGGKALPDEMLDEILAKTDGVPLFVEELTKTVLESGLLTDAGDHYALAGPLVPLAIPATLHDSLMARLDRLASVKEVAQAGAVIGREFSHELLAAVSHLPEDELRESLNQLVASELVFPPRLSTRRNLYLQARPGSGRRLSVAPQEHAATNPPEDRKDTGGAVPGHCGDAARATRLPLHGGAAHRSGHRLLATGRPTRFEALGDGGGDRAALESPGVARKPTAVCRARPQGARPAHRPDHTPDRLQGNGCTRNGADDHPRAEPLRATRRDDATLPCPLWTVGVPSCQRAGRQGPGVR